MLPLSTLPPQRMGIHTQEKMYFFSNQLCSKLPTQYEAVYSKESRWFLEVDGVGSCRGMKRYLVIRLVPSACFIRARSVHLWQWLITLLPWSINVIYLLWCSNLRYLFYEKHPPRKIHLKQLLFVDHQWQVCLLEQDLNEKTGSLIRNQRKLFQWDSMHNVIALYSLKWHLFINCSQTIWWFRPSHLGQFVSHRERKGLWEQNVMSFH